MVQIIVCIVLNNSTTNCNISPNFRLEATVYTNLGHLTRTEPMKHITHETLGNLLKSLL